MIIDTIANNSFYIETSPIKEKKSYNDTILEIKNNNFPKNKIGVLVDFLFIKFSEGMKLIGPFFHFLYLFLFL